MFELVLGVQIVAILILFAMGLYISFQQPSEMQCHLIMICVSTIVMMVGYIGELLATSLDTAMFSVAFAYLGKPLGLLASTLFVASYCNRHIPKWLVTLLFCFCPLFPALIFTNNFHHLYYSTVQFIEGNTIFSNLVLGHGPLYFLYMFFTLAYMLYNTAIVIHELAQSRTKEEKSQVFFILVMILSAMVGYGFYLTGLTGGYDTTMFGCFISTLALFGLFLRCRFFETVSVAKSVALQDANSGLMVLDTRNRVVYTNTVFSSLLHDHVVENDKLIAEPDGQKEFTVSGKTYSLAKKPVEKSGHRLGWIIEVRDITASHDYTARLEKDVEERVRTLQHVQRKVIAALSDIVEARDAETGNHVRNTIEYTRLIAEDLSARGVYTDTLSPTYISYLTDAAPLHDIGKISIPDSVLLKPGRLTAAEFEIIKTHTTAGDDIIERTMRGVESDIYVNIAKNVARCHHEKWDGSGYPNHLAGEDIPLSARIVAVSDVYDAVRSRRCYKPPFTKEEALRLIREDSGTHFDPEVVRSFLNIVDQVDNGSDDES